MAKDEELDRDTDDAPAAEPPEHDAITDADVSPVVNLKSPDDDDDDVEAAEPGETRKDRRKKNIRAIERERDARVEAERRAAAAEARLQAAEQQRQQYTQPQRQADPLEAQIGEIKQRRQNIVYRLKNDASLSNDDAQRLVAEAERLDDHRMELVARRAAPQGAPVQTQVDIENRMLAAEFPQVFSDPAARIQAQAELMDLVRAGEPMSLDTAKKAARRIAERRGYIKAPASAPSASTQARYGGTPSRPSSGSGTGGVRLSQEQMRLARAMSPGKDDKDAAERWAREIGRPNKLL